MILWILLIILGFVLLIKGADFLVDGGSSIAQKFHIPEIVIGLTVVSIGTSLPELFISVTSAVREYPDERVHPFRISAWHKTEQIYIPTEKPADCCFI